MDKKIIAARIRHYRRLKKWTQEELAAKAEMSDVYVRMLEAGERSPSLEIIMRLAETLDTTPNNLLLPAAVLGKVNGVGLNEVLSDCSAEEIEIILQLANKVKQLLREYHSK